MTTEIAVKEINVLSLGAGVQSSTMLLMACLGQIIPKPDFVIFADTGWEPIATYKYLEWLKTEVKKYSVEVITTIKGNIRDDLMLQTKMQDVIGKKSFTNLPFFVLNKDGTKAISKRQCTAEYKIRPIQKRVRTLLGYLPRKRVKEKVIMWRGISLDEIERVAPSREKWITNRHPLIELEMTRLDCLNWCARNGFPTPPKSSCIGCPFHSDRMWLEMKRDNPIEWKDAVEVDKAIKKLPRFNGQAFLHRSCKPLEEVYLNEDQLEMDFEGFANECAGVCGV